MSKEYNITYTANGTERKATFDNDYDAKLFGRALRENPHAGHDVEDIRFWEVTERLRQEVSYE